MKIGYRIVVLFLLSLLETLPVRADIVYEMTVAQDGSGDYDTIQAAIDNTKAFPDKRITIHIKNGTYREKVRVYEWNPMVSLIGEDAGKTIITWGDHFKQIDKGRNSTFHTPTLQVDGDDFHGENLTIENTAGPVGQAVALAVNADRVSFYNSRFLGHQDTLYLTGEGKRQYFRNCYVEGTTDFIFGRATAVFDQCQIHSKSDSYITAASTPEGIPHGFVFLNATLTADKDVDEVYLGRPWRDFARTVFINTDMGAHIKPEGWHNWSKPEAEHTVLYGEYNSRGPGAQPHKRVQWQTTLSEEQADDYTLETILGEDGWYRAR
ncbi:pectinesterase family protein [Marinimicrobium sp. LS-A18]|uniref:pectinesterase family protein n=1 Tax=Marinimicrobium sp. LS-A18 TaxID=1381596 RepID=UPI0004651E77|nr:pectinesterase family protein [Marinimicrobium sp. LS-A18]